MRIPIKIDTLYGEKQFSILQSQYDLYKDNPQHLEEFKKRCREDHDLVSHYFNFFVEDPVMNRQYKMDESDTEGWRIFRHMGDMTASLSYFGR